MLGLRAGGAAHSLEVATLAGRWKGDRRPGCRRVNSDGLGPAPAHRRAPRDKFSTCPPWPTEATSAGLGVRVRVRARARARARCVRACVRMRARATERCFARFGGTQPAAGGDQSGPADSDGRVRVVAAAAAPTQGSARRSENHAQTARRRLLCARSELDRQSLLHLFSRRVASVSGNESRCVNRIFGAAGAPSTTASLNAQYRQVFCFGETTPFTLLR